MKRFFSFSLGLICVMSFSSIPIFGGDFGGDSPMSDVDRSLNRSQNQFQSNDLDVSRGGVNLSEEDLRIPGKNGLDVVISRSYSSLSYRADASINPTTAKTWGAYAGHGWHFNMGLRAYVVDIDADLLDTKRRIAIERGGSVDLFDYDSATGRYKSRTPGSTEYAEKIMTSGVSIHANNNVSQIVLHTDSGQIITFGKVFFGLSFVPRGGSIPIRSDYARGFFVTSIADNAGNTIQFNYTGYTGDSLEKTSLDKITTLFGRDCYNQFFTTLTQYYPWYATASYWGVFTRLSSITDSFGRVITFTYGEASNKGPNKIAPVTSISYTNPNGGTNQIKYGYDANGNLESIQTGNLPASTYTYRNYSLGGQYEDGYLLETHTTPLGARTEYTYTVSGEMDGNDRILDYHHIPVVTQKRVYAYTETGALSKTWTYSVSYPLSRNSEPKPSSYTPTWNTDVKPIYFPTVTIDNPSEIEDETFTFKNGLLTRHVQGISRTDTDWDFNKNVKLAISTYKSNVLQIKTINQGYDAYNNPTKVTTQRGSGGQMVQDITYYTDSGFLNQNLTHLPKTVSVYDPNNPSAARNNFTTYTAQGKPYETYEGLNASGKKVKTDTYDSIGRIASETTYGPGGNMTVVYSYSLGSTYRITQTMNGKSAISEYENYTGRLISSTDVNGNTTRYDYDNYGRKIRVTYPDNHQDTMSYSSDLKTTTTTQSGRTVIQIVDSLGRPVIIQNPSGEEDSKTDYYYSDLPSAIYTRKNSGAWTLKKSFAYDKYLRKTSATSPDWGTTQIEYDTPQLNATRTTDPLGRQAIVYQNELGQKTQTTFVPDNANTIFTYNSFGELIQTVDPKGLIRKMDVDAKGRPYRSYFTARTNPPVRSQITYADAGQDFMTTTQTFTKTGALFHTYTYDYDSEGRMTATRQDGQIKDQLTYDETSKTNGKAAITKAENPDAITQYDRDTMGRVIRETLTVKALNKTFALNSAYTANGQLSSITYPDGKQISYTYDGHQRVQSILLGSKTIATFTYNFNGSLATLTYGNGTQISYTYTKDVLLSQLQASISNRVLYSQSNTFDGVGRTTQIQHSDYLDSGPDATRAYTYTAKDELLTVGINGTPTYTHHYDANSNHLRFETQNNKNLGVDNMSLDPDSEQLLQKNYTDGRSVRMLYDAEGCMVSKTRYQGLTPVETTAYAYNYQGQLKTVSRNNQVLATYGYDHAGQRIYSQDNQTGIQKWAYWANGQLIGEGAHGNNLDTDYNVRYIYSGNYKIAMERYNQATQQYELYYFINNAQGTPVLITDEAGGTVSKLNLDEWGNVGNRTAGPDQEINLTGKRMDTNTGLYYFNQRYYDPELGRFLTEDPAKQSLNAYLFCGNNPLMYVDPDGQFFILDDLFVAVLIGALTGAAVSAAVQYVTTGTVNWDAVGQAAIGGAISGGIFNMVGGAALQLGWADGALGKVGMHVVAGGLSSMAQGGDFWSGAVGAGVAEAVAPGIMGSMNDPLGRIGASSLVGGVSSWAVGGDFYHGALAGGFGMAFNDIWHEAIPDPKTPNANNKDGTMKPGAKAAIQTYGPDGLAIAGSTVAIVATAPVIVGVGVGMGLAASAWGAYNTYSTWSTSSIATRTMGVISSIPFLPDPVAIGHASASILYNATKK